MTEMVFQVTMTATGEVRDKDGNLVEEVSGESTRLMTVAELRDYGLEPPEGTLP